MVKMNFLLILGLFGLAEQGHGVINTVSPTAQSKSGSWWSWCWRFWASLCDLVPRIKCPFISACWNRYLKKKRYLCFSVPQVSYPTLFTLRNKSLSHFSPMISFWCLGILSKLLMVVLASLPDMSLHSKISDKTV